MSNEAASPLLWWNGLGSAARDLLLGADPEFSVPPAAMPTTDEERTRWPELVEKNGIFFLPESGGHEEEVRLHLLQRRKDEAYQEMRDAELPDGHSGPLDDAWFTERDRLVEAHDSARESFVMRFEMAKAAGHYRHA